MELKQWSENQSIEIFNDCVKTHKTSKEMEQ